MKLIDTLKGMRSVYRKQPNLVVEFNLLTLIVGEVETISKRSLVELSDTEVLTIITKLSKSVNESLAVSSTDKLNLERDFLLDILSQFTPTQLIGSQIIFRLDQNGITNMGDAMKFLKSNFAGQYDGKLASDVVKQHFAK